MKLTCGSMKFPPIIPIYILIRTLYVNSDCTGYI